MKHLFAAMLLASWSLIGPPEHLYVTKQATGQQIWMGLQAPLSAWTHYQPTIRRKNARQAGSLTLGQGCRKP
jgi:hypothetical protein